MAKQSRPHAHIRAAWDRFSNAGEIAVASLDEVKSFIEQRGLIVEQIEDVEFGFNPRINAIHIKTNAGSALYPRQKLDDIAVYQKNIAPIQNEESFWQSVDWFIPTFMSHAAINKGIAICGIKVTEHNNLSKSQLQERFEPALSSIYTLGNIIPITVQTLPDSIAIGKHLPIIKESILAFYSGMKIAAIAALIPIIEDILGSIIGEDSSGLDLIAKANKAIDLANQNVIKLHINNADWIPPEYIEIDVLKILNERILILETMRHWLTNSFYSKTDTYANYSGFNRHFFAHAKSDIWQNTNNFFRAMGLIQALAFIECFAVEESTVSIFPPTLDSRSESFHLEVLACISTQLFKKTY